MKYLTLATGAALAFSIFYFTAKLEAKDQSRIESDQAYVLRHVLKGKPCVR